MAMDPAVTDGTLDNCFISFQDYGNFYFEAYSDTCASPQADFKYKYSNYSTNKDAFTTDYNKNAYGKIESNTCGSSSATEETLLAGGVVDFTDKCDAYVSIKKFSNFTSSGCVEWKVYGNMHASYIKGALIIAVGSLFTALI